MPELIKERVCAEVDGDFVVFLLPEWQAFNKTIGSNGDVGIWHETYVIPRGHSESVYVNMPRYGLGLAGSVFSAKGSRATAAKRLSGMTTPGSGWPQ